MSYQWLDNVDRSKKVTIYGALKASYIVLHNTMGGPAAGSIKFLNEKTNGFGYHVLIDRDGTVFQTAPFDRITRHAGLSNWRGWDNLNGFSIGVSLANYGPLKMSRGTYHNEYGVTMKSRDVFPDPAAHYNGATKYKDGSWERYPEAQVAAALRVCESITENLSIRDIVRHDDVAIGRKVDTGPALDLKPFTKLVGDRSAELLNRWRTVTPGDTLTIRDHHSHRGNVLGSLADKSEVYVLSKSYYRKRPGKWWLISMDGLNRTGFVHSDYLEFAEPYA